MIGFLNVYKPAGITSSAVVGKLRKKFNIKKIGHMGTLDPMAEGVLPLAIGKATRMFDYFLDKVKTYKATFEFGYETDSLDITGNIIKTCKEIPTKEQLIEAIQEKLIGKINQVPPNFSAKHIDGKRAYELARDGEIFELKPNLVEIMQFDLLRQVNNNTYEFIITCSSGTYIRSLGRDLGYAVNSFGTMTKLIRIKSGFFDLENALDFNMLLEETDITNFLTPINSVFPNFKIIEIISKNDFENLKNGVKIKSNIIEDKSFLYYKSQLIGVAGYENGLLFIKTNLLENAND